ncbi:hypothetical protein [Sphingomonas sp. LaA6.9]|uniref:hypothetical protein n=1 Tax=Sphingomonas sp. LaA6.9 TaxID=2919914 RepID=UPI001F4FE91A|nr:hypothetical protein [Sphingomonas sp. LaA6.9]MCJ8159853.1 hypothetical protein [Sphingomonas sp. LaA6.9]
MNSGPQENEKQERLQRVRIGATGLAAVFLVVLSAGAIINSASDEIPVQEQANVEAPMGLPDIVGNDLAEDPLPQEPLAELGVAPSTASNESGVNADAAGKGP